MEEAQITTSGSSDLTIMGLFFAADPVVKLVMLLLVVLMKSIDPEELKAAQAEFAGKAKPSATGAARTKQQASVPGRG